jgi:hypothetical protein
MTNRASMNQTVQSQPHQNKRRLQKEKYCFLNNDPFLIPDFDRLNKFNLFEIEWN